MLTTVAPSVLAAFRHVASPALRGILWRSLGLTVICLGLLWYGLTAGLGAIVGAHPLSADYPIVDSVLVFVAGAGLFVGLLYVLPAVSALVAGFFLDDAAAIVERADFPGQPAGRALSLPRSVGVGFRFAALSLAVNLLALTLLFVPGVNLVSLFAANTYLLGREYFEMAAGRFRPMADAAELRREHRGTVLLAGAAMAGLMLVPILNLATPIFGIALMVHLHKRIAARLRPPV